MNSSATTVVIQRLQSLRRAGVTHVPRAPQPADDPASDPPRTAAESAAPCSEPPETRMPAARMTETPAAGEPAAAERVAGEPAVAERAARPGPADVAARLQVLGEEVAGCTACAELAQARTQTVFGVGNPSARLCFLGEAPGADEDRLGEPFVGRAGQLLDKIIAACTLRREDVYILNVLKCRPPRNRKPLPDEVRRCRGFFESQLEAIRPEFICCLGGVAAQALLDTNLPVGMLRGRLHDYRGIKVVVTYHPSYLLRDESAKRHTWSDMKMLMREMGIPIPAAKSR